MADRKIRLPEEFRASFKLLRSLEPDALTRLFSVIESETPTLQRRTLLNKIRQNLPEIKIADARSIFDFLLSLLKASANAGISDEQLASDICDSLGEDELPAADKERAKGIIVQALQNKGLAVTAKANAVRVSHGRVFRRASIFTDIRPIFADDSTVPLAATLVHNLRINYGEDGEEKAIYVAMDGVDLNSLRKTIDRAFEKAKSLAGILDAAKLKHLTDE